MNAAEAATLAHPAWARNAVIYQVNLRQFTPEGTIAAFMSHLPRLAAMGVDILYLMPVQPIGLKNRKGTLGSSYAVADYLALNPEFGTMADFKALVHAAHDAGLRVIIDWVANHNAWDHVWVDAHADWYLKNADGEIHSYVYDNGHEPEAWTDVVGLDWGCPALWDAMQHALEFWVCETGIDGYRCDVAGLVPLAFWERARAALDAIKPVFLLAEWCAPELHARAFDASYDWALHDVMKRIAKGRGDARDLAAHLDGIARQWPADAWRMTFTSNHDKNAWDGHDDELFGPAFRAFAVLAATLPGIPLVYGGQEAGLDKRIAFFDRDPIDWKALALADFYAGLFTLKHRHPALAAGTAGAPLQRLAAPGDAVFAFRRELPGDCVSIVVNLSDQPQSLPVDGISGIVNLRPWGWLILE